MSYLIAINAKDWEIKDKDKCQKSRDKHTKPKLEHTRILPLQLRIIYPILRIGPTTMTNELSNYRYHIPMDDIYKTRGKGPTDGGHTGTEKRSTRRSTQTEKAEDYQ
jgi:hypothetical protein